MAITKTTTVQRTEVYPAGDPSGDSTANSSWPTIMVVYEDSMDDPDDSDLPVVATRVKSFSRYVENGGDATDVTGEAQLVQDLCAAIWT